MRWPTRLRPGGSPGTADQDRQSNPTADAAPTLTGRALTVLARILPGGAITLSVLTLGTYAMGLVRDRMFAHFFGAGADLDAYNAAFVLPELALDVLVAGGLVAPFVPLFLGLKGEAEEAARAFGRTILTLAVVVMAIAAAVLFILAPETVGITGPGFTPAQRELYVGLFRVMCLTPVIFAASVVLGEVLVAEQRFLLYGMAPLLYNGGIAAGTLLLADRLGIYAAAVGAVGGAIAHLAIRVVGVLRTTFRPRPMLALRTKGLGEFMRLMLPKMVSQPIEPLTFLYFTAVASTFEAGSVSSVSFARNYQSMPVSLIGLSFAVAAFPALSAAAAAGDRRAFGRVLGTNLAAIGAFATAAAIALFLVRGLLIGVLLGGGAFDSEDVARTTLVLGAFTLSIPLESWTHLLARALYATRTTILPTIASVAGFVAIVLVTGLLAPGLGLVAIPIGFAVGMAVKVVLLAVALAPRVARMGAQAPAGVRAGRHPRAAWMSPRTGERRRRLVQAGLAVALVSLAGGTVYATSQALSGATIAVVPDVTPWAREFPAAVPSVPPLPSSPVVTSGGSPTAGTSTSPGASAPIAPSPSPTPTPGPFAMDLYQKGDFVGEFTDTWCVPAAMQTSMNIMSTGADVSKAMQTRLWHLAYSLAPGKAGGADPEGWAEGLAQLGYGNYAVDAVPTLKAAVHEVVRQIRLTGRPAGLVVWKGWHSWVVSGFKATADPAVTDSFTVTALYIEDVWYPRVSSLWSQTRGGHSRPPDSLVPVSALPQDFLPWKQWTSYPGKDGKFVVVIPVN